MAKKKQEEGKKGLPEWMGTYGDMVTLLLTFFILLFSMSTVDAQKFQQIVQSVLQGSPGVLEGGVKITDGLTQVESVKKVKEKVEKQDGSKKYAELQNIKNKVQEHLKSKGMNQKVQVQQFDNYVKINFLDNVLFDSGKADLKPDAFGILDAIYEKLVEFPQNKVKVEGHTDNVPIKTVRFRNNWELSSIRAVAVTTYYVENKGINPKKISPEGFGEYEPIAGNNTIEGREKNRRVEIKIMSQFNDISVGGE